MLKWFMSSRKKTSEVFICPEYFNIFSLTLKIIKLFFSFKPKIKNLMF